MTVKVTRHHIYDLLNRQQAWLSTAKRVKRGLEQLGYTGGVDIGANDVIFYGLGKDDGEDPLHYWERLGTQRGYQ